jgi:hypothetical protein
MNKEQPQGEVIAQRGSTRPEPVDPVAAGTESARLAEVTTRTALGVAAAATLALAPLLAQSGGVGPLRRVNVPYIGAADPFAPAIFWLGRVTMSSNYADVRAFYYDGALRVYLHIPDRLLWHDAAPSAATLDAWDAVSLYIDRAGPGGAAPRQTSYRFVKQLGHTGEARSRAAFRGTGSGWVLDAAAFAASDSWRGNYPNDTVWDVGWQAEFDIPFASLGLTGPASPGTVWGLGVAVHDRDDAAAGPLADQVWPERLQPSRPETWGELRFGRPVHTPSTTTVSGTTVVRRGLGGASVVDAAVGGHTVCGEGMNAWTEWGNANYAGYAQFNVQNQWDISDFMCFSKFYVTFPLTGVPPGRAIASAKVRLNLFGNAGYVPGDARPSAIDVLTVAEDWAESSITWNNAPLASENVSVTWVHPVDAAHPAGPYEWDVSYAVAAAYAAGLPLRLVFYSTDGDYHSGKYFWSSDADDGLAGARPTLEVRWGLAGPPTAPTGVRVRVP